MVMSNKVSNVIELAVSLLKIGELVAFPTETVYGLGADAANPEAVKKIFTAKGRPADHPVIIHVFDLEHISQWVKFLPETAIQLDKHFWPGPMTLILPAAEHVSSFITGGQDTIGIRMPSHPLARELLKAFGGAIAAPSANRFGRISPTTSDHVRKEFGDTVRLILDGGSCQLGIESTIIDLTHQPPRLLRPGPLNIEQIEKMSGVKVIEHQENTTRVSGNLASHYAPQTPVYLMTNEQLQAAVIQEKNIAVMSLSSCQGNPIARVQMPHDAEAYAHELYAELRRLDELKLQKILIEMPPSTLQWHAIHNRLIRAASRQ
jgi:L-threonylcarbamoyladenylate synthase